MLLDQKEKMGLLGYRVNQDQRGQPDWKDPKGILAQQGTLEKKESQGCKELKESRVEKAQKAAQVHLVRPDQLGQLESLEIQDYLEAQLVELH